MNDHPTPTDEELSAAVDGLADDELLRRIAASPEATARLAELQAAADLVAGSAVPPLDDDAIDQLIAGTIDTPLAPARRPGRGPAPWLGAAAVVLLMALGLTLIWAGQDSSSDRAASTSASVDKSAADLEATEAAGGGSAAASSTTIVGEMSGRTSTAADTGSPPTTMAPSTASAWGAAQYLGTYDDGAALRTATATSFAQAQQAYSVSRGSAPTSDATVPSSKAVDRCAEQLQITLSLKSPPTASAWATVDGKPVLVYEFATTSAATGKPTTLVAAVGVDACEQVVIFER